MRRLPVDSMVLEHDIVNTLCHICHIKETYDAFEFTDSFPGAAVKSQARSLLTADNINVLATAMYSCTNAEVLQREMVSRIATAVSKRLAEAVARVVGIWRK